MPVSTAQAVAGQVDPAGVIADYFISQGILGVLVAVLGYEVLRLRKEAKDKDVAHRADIAAKDALINDLQEARLAENREGFAIARSVTSTLDAVVAATRGRP